MPRRVCSSAITRRSRPVDEAAEAEPETPEQNPYFVIDPVTGNPVHHTQCDTPAISGTTQVRGRNAVTVWDVLVEGQKPYTVDWAAEITGIPAERIASLAEEYAEGPSSLALGWGGNDKMTNADIAGMPPPCSWPLRATWASRARAWASTWASPTTATLRRSARGRCRRTGPPRRPR